METTLHRELKRLYAGGDNGVEKSLAGYRIDAVADGRLIEVQVASLSAIRPKIRQLLQQHFDVTVVKPITARKQIVWRQRRGGREVSRRWSPHREGFREVFVELVYFVDIFPHPRLTLELLLTTEEEWRVPRRTCGRRRRNYSVEDRRLLSIDDRRELRAGDDLLDLLPTAVKQLTNSGPFTTQDLAAAADVPRWMAQKMAYCLRHLGVWEAIGKRQRAWLYRPKVKRVAA